jgi:hypothetical protein
VAASPLLVNSKGGALDVDGNEYVDYKWTASKWIIKAIQQAANMGPVSAFRIP